VDELKAELARKDMLIREINHRAKNNLALAASLVKMEAGFSSDIPSNQILKQTQKRLETLASIHELLYMGPGTSGEINMKDYLGQIAHGLMKGFGQPNVRLELHIDSAILDMKVANTIGLLVNELMSNAFKHAFSSEKDGVLKVDFFERPDSFKLRVSDNGPGLQSTKAKDSSLGNILIDEFVKQLHGTMEIDSTHGTTYLISIKKSTFSA
jgi:two-component sensor histidine kinase